MTLSVTRLASSLIYIVLPNFFCFHISSISSTLFPRSSKIVLYRWYFDFLIVRKIENLIAKNDKMRIKKTSLTHLMPLVFYDTHWKHQKIRGFLMFSGVSKETSGVKWVKDKSTVIKGSSPNFLCKNKLIAERCRFV